MSEIIKNPQHCIRCKTTYEKSHFAGKLVCPKCIAKQTAGSIDTIQKKNEEKEMFKKADETYLAKEPVRARPKRTPLNARNQLDYTNKEDGFTYHWFNDKEGKIDQATSAGWETVTDADKTCANDKMVEGARLPGSTVAKPVGFGVNAYLMRKPTSEYEEDMEAHTHSRNCAREAAILAPEQQNSSFYTRKDVPIKIGTGLHEKQIKSLG